MSVPGVATQPPPAYSFVPTPQELHDTKPSDIVGEAATHSYEITTFVTNGKELGSDKDYRSWGTLGLGVQYPHGVLQHVGTYKPPLNKGPDGKMVAGSECDISNSIELVADSNLPSTSMHYIKHADHITEYSFDIVVTDYGTERAAFTGTMTTQKGTYDWYGEYSDHKKVTKQFAKVPIQPPAGLKGSISELVNITPIAWEAQGNIKPGEDAAQKYGDELMYRITMHGLDPETRKALLPKLPDIDATARSILDNNRVYFQRAAVHLLADQLKDMKEVEKLANGITAKFTLFRDMLVGKGGSDASIIAYGLNPSNEKHAALVATLRSQYQTVLMRCYQEGYKLHCPAWERYLEQPVYWFNVYSEFLISPEHVGPWQVSVVQRAKETGGKISIDQELLQWGNKLSMLKAVAPQDAQEALNIDKVTGNLAGQAQMAVAYSQLVDDDLLKQAQLLFGELDSTEGSAEFKKTLAERSSYSAEIDRGVRAEGLAILTRLVNKDSRLAIESEGYWKKRLPADGSRVPGQRMTVGQFIASWEDEARLQEWRQADNFPPLEDGPQRTLWQRVKGGGSALLGLFKTALHVVAFTTLIGQLATETKMRPIELARTICALASESINAIGWASRKALNWLWNKGFVFRNAIGWFNDCLRTNLDTIGKRVANAVAGSIGKIIRLIGLAGCICSIISAYWDMKKAESMNKNDRTAFLWYSRVSFALGCLEGLAIVTALAAEVFGWVSCAAICGPIGMVIGIAMIGVTIIYHVFFGPDPLSDIKRFLRGEAKEAGCYHED